MTVPIKRLGDAREWIGSIGGRFGSKEGVSGGIEG
jgi:hypothetical protein